MALYDLPEGEVDRRKRRGLGRGVAKALGGDETDRHHDGEEQKLLHTQKPRSDRQQVASTCV